ncbi:unnamed protein product [Rhizophagus irregularis]|uniref:Uncharacterized protein n=1 Tax=Rhizophagus irregularis TaxID=588596 RepID=A0A915ZDZ6_9GLOM|nr:unnamed protein product [Rhizophagus irregularis]
MVHCTHETSFLISACILKVLLSKTKFCNHVCLHSTVDSCNALYRIVYKFSLYLSTIPIPLIKNLFRLNLKNLSNSEINKNSFLANILTRPS